jgi:hypothetical protein
MGWGVTPASPDLIRSKSSVVILDFGRCTVDLGNTRQEPETVDSDPDDLGEGTESEDRDAEVGGTFVWVHSDKYRDLIKMLGPTGTVTHIFFVDSTDEIPPIK